MTIREQLTLLQRLSGLTQEDLADRLDVSFVALNAWINERALPRQSAQRRIAELLAAYGVQKDAKDPLLAIKRSLSVRAKKRRRVIADILGHPDIHDEFVLALTYHSNGIEGSTLTKGETAAVLFDDAVLKNRTLKEQIEAKNHQAALEYVIHSIKPHSKIREHFMHRLHEILLNGIQADAGQYRRTAVRIVGANIPTANPASVGKRMTQWVRRLNQPEADTIAHATRLHAEFEQIHPFTDGNGRVGRLLLTAMLLRKNYAPAVIEQQRKRDYLTFLNKAQRSDDLLLLERFMSEAVLLGWAILDRKRGT